MFCLDCNINFTGPRCTMCGSPDYSTRPVYRIKDALPGHTGKMVMAEHGIVTDNKIKLTRFNELLPTI